MRAVDVLLTRGIGEVEVGQHYFPSYLFPFRFEIFCQPVADVYELAFYLGRNGRMRQ